MSCSSCFVNVASKFNYYKRSESSLVSSGPLAYVLDKSRVQTLSLCLIVLSLMDLLVTYLLLYNYFPDVYEANPVAQWFFLRWNILGMTLFKFTLVASVIVMGEVIERHRQGLGKTIMIFACVAAGAVVYQGLHIYSDLAFDGLSG